MRLSIDHRTVYRFSNPQTRLVQMLRMTPSDTNDQTITAWRIDIDCDARLKLSRDGFGNKVTMLYAEGPISAIEICVAGEVLRAPHAGIIDGSIERFAPGLYLRSTPLTQADPAMAGFAQVATGGNKAIDHLQALCRAVCDRFAQSAHRQVAGRSAIQAFAQDQASACDMADIFIACARSQAVPARHVSGYRLQVIDGQRRTSPHHWAEAYVDGVGWVAFDPCTGQRGSHDYVRVAIGLDSAGAAPVAGSRLGEGSAATDGDIGS